MQILKSKKNKLFSEYICWKINFIKPTPNISQKTLKTMKKFKITFLFSFLMLLTFNLSAQTEQNTQEPQVTITFKTTPKTNPVIEQVNKLTDYDDNLTEMVIEQMYINRNTKITSIVSDEEFNNMKEEDRNSVIKESEVMEIINLFRN